MYPDLKFEKKNIYFLHNNVNYNLQISKGWKYQKGAVHFMKSQGTHNMSYNRSSLTV